MADLDPSEYTVEELSDELDEIDDAETLQEIREAETDGQDRTGAEAVIEERLEAISDDQQGEEGESDTTAEQLESAAEEMENDDESENEDGDGDEDEDEVESGDGSEGSDGTSAGIVEVRNRVRDSTSDLIGRPLDGIVEIEQNEGDWHALVEIVERNSVPDTQDIIGRYALDLDGDGEIVGYRRLERYRRGDTRTDDEAPAGGR